MPTVYLIICRLYFDRIIEICSCIRMYVPLTSKNNMGEKKVSVAGATTARDIVREVKEKLGLQTPSPNKRQTRRRSSTEHHSTAGNAARHSGRQSYHAGQTGQTHDKSAR